MQFTKKTSKDRNFSIWTIIKIIIAIFIIVFGLCLLIRLICLPQLNRLKKFYQMKISKLLSKILFFAYFFLFIQFVYAQEIKEIWSEIEKEVTNIDINNKDNNSSNIKQLEGVKVKLSDENILVEQNLDTPEILLAGLFDPDDNDLNIDMWSKTDGIEIKKLLKKIQSKIIKFCWKINGCSVIDQFIYPKTKFLRWIRKFYTWLSNSKERFWFSWGIYSKNSSIKDKERLIKHVADYNLSLNKIKIHAQLLIV